MNMKWWVALAAIFLLILFAWRFFLHGPVIITPDVEPPEDAEFSDKARFQDWNEFTSPSGDFKVLLPTLPQHAAEKLEDPSSKEIREYDMFVSEDDNGNIFMISRITWLQHPEFKVNEQTFSGIMSKLLESNPNSKLKTMKKTSFKGYPAIEFSIDSEQIALEGLAFIVDESLYTLTVIAKAHLLKENEFNFFINSFDIIKKPASEKKSEPVPASPAAR